MKDVTKYLVGGLVGAVIGVLLAPKRPRLLRKSSLSDGAGGAAESPQRPAAPAGHGEEVRSPVVAVEVPRQALPVEEPAVPLTEAVIEADLRARIEATKRRIQSEGDALSAAGPEENVVP